MTKQFGYKKYMKKKTKKNNNFFIKLFLVTLFSMLIAFTFIFKSFTPDVDVSIGDYKPEPEISDEIKSSVDNRLSIIQDEDQGKTFTELMTKAEDEQLQTEKKSLTNDGTREMFAVPQNSESLVSDSATTVAPNNSEIVYKVYIGSYTSAEQAKVAKEIILESGNELNPIVKCIGSNNYTLQVGIFKNKTSAESLLYTIQQNHLPGRIIEDN